MFSKTNDRKLITEKRKWALYAFLLNLSAGILSFAWVMLTHKGLFSVAGDFNVQQIPFAMYANSAIKSGNVVWDWSLDLGSNFIGGMTFYILGNPSFWLSLLFPADAFMYVVGWLYILKYAFAGLTSFLWFRRHVRNPKNAVIVSMLYAFSGFMNEDLLFYHFHDVAVLFPLMMIAVDLYMEEGKKGWLIPATLLNAWVNYFFLPGEVIFLAAYFILRFVMDDGAQSWKKLPGILAEGVIGGLCGCVLLLPAAIFTMQNPRVGNDYWGNNALAFTTERYLFILKSMIFPGEVMSDQSAVIEHNFASCAAYLPMVGMVCVIAFVILKKKHWLTRMLKWCLVMAVVPILNASFSLFAGLYHRWYYMPVLLFALCTGLLLDELEAQERVWENPTPAENAVTKATVIWGLITFGFIAFMMFVPWSSTEESRIYRMDVFTAWSVISVAGTLLTWLILTHLFEMRRMALTVGIFVFSVLTTASVLYLYQAANVETAEELKDRIDTSKEFIDPSPEYRYFNRDNPETLTHGYPSTANFCSTVSGSIFRFYESLGLERDVKSPDAPDGMRNLVSARYAYATEQTDELGMLIRKIEGESRTYYIYEDSSIPPIGYCYNSYMTESEFLKENTDKRALIMLKTLVVPDDKEDLVKECLHHYEPENDGPASFEYLTEISAAHLDESAEEAESSTDSYKCMIQAESPKYAFFSIPNDSGWTCHVNGEEEEIIDVNGFMAVRVDEGNNLILFEYRVPGLAAGTALSVLGILLAALYIFFTGKHRRKEKTVRAE